MISFIHNQSKTEDRNEKLYTDRVRFLLVFLALAMIGGCQDKGVEVERIKSPREYTWTVDTLEYPGSYQTAMRDIWGSSPTNVYVVGHNESPGPGTMFRFDGQAWNTTAFHAAEGGPISGPVSLSAIHGFAANDIWVVGERISSNPNPPPNFLDSSLIIHFDGVSWEETKVEGPALRSVWGASRTSVYAVGDDGTSFHYDGTGWSKELLPYAVQLVSIGGDEVQLFAAGAILGSGAEDTLMIFSNVTSGWSMVDRQPEVEFNLAPRFGLSIYSPAPGSYYTSTWGVFEWRGLKWEKVMTSNIALSLGGGGSNNIFAVGQFGKGYHWDGNDWSPLKIPVDQLPADVWLQGIWTDGKEAFVVGNDGLKTYILHGK